MQLLCLNMTINDNHKSAIKLFGPPFSDKHILLLFLFLLSQNLTGCKKTRRYLTLRWIRRTLRELLGLYINHWDVSQQRITDLPMIPNRNFLWPDLCQLIPYPQLNIVCKRCLHAQPFVTILKKNTLVNVDHIRL